MAKIPLRVYNREIEELIDRGQTDEALARCKQILQIYPKYIEAYRLLGKAYLECQRYTEAADVFQRLLSSVPDDFVSHVGMSIIREDEGDLDGAIWHMERATEIQPSNTAVQDELRRLFARREGVEPTRLRMTRGGLVRMYVRGDLYQQAITEALAALSEDPERTDIQVLLARMYNLTGQRVKAAEVCGELLKKIPYCYEANWIMHEILPGTAEAEQIQVYLERVCELDPYAVHVTGQLAPEDVPDSAIVIDRMEWDPTSAVSSQPGWASNLGIHLDSQEPQGHVLPDWLASLSPIPSLAVESDIPPVSGSENPSIDNQSIPMENDVTNPDDSVSPDSPQPQSDRTSDNSNIPNWMQEAGWEISKQPQNQEVSAFKFDDVENELPTALPADEIPEWLKPLAPVVPEEMESSIESSENVPLEGLAWVQALANPQAETVPNPEVPESAQEIPEINLEPIEPTSELPSEADFSISVPAQPEPAIEPALPIVESLLPEMEDSAALGLDATEVIKTEAEETMPDWLKDLENFAAQPVSSEGSVQALIPDQEVSSVPPTISGDEDQAAMIDWLEDIAVHHTAEAQTVISHPEDRISKPPTWVNRLNDESSTPEESSIPDWLQGIEEPDFTLASEPAEPPKLASEEAVPDWLTGYQPPEPVQPQSPAESSLPDESQQPPVSVPLVPELAPVMADQLPVHEENIPVIQPEAQEENLPDWLIALSQEPLDAEEILPEEPAQPAVPAMALETPLSEWDMALLGEPHTEEPLPPESLAPENVESEQLTESAIPAEQASLDWLSAFQVDSTSEVETPSTEDENLSELESAWAPETFPEDLVTPEISTKEVQAEPELPEWLRMLEEPAEGSSTVESLQESGVQAAAPIIETPSVPLSEEVLPAISVEEPTAYGPEIIEEEIPQVQLPTEDLPIEVTATESEQVSEELPDWLRGFETSLHDADAQLGVVEPTESIPVVAPVPEAGSTPESASLPYETIEPPFDVVPVLEPESPQEVTVEPAQELPVSSVAEEQVQEQVTPSVLEKLTTEPDIFETTPTLPPEPSQEISPEVLVVEVPVSESALEAPPQDATLAIAQAALNSGNLSQALEQYNTLIHSGVLLEETIHDLRDSIYRYPVDPLVWQSLGDAYLRMNQVQDALDAYTKAEELIR